MQGPGAWCPATGDTAAVVSGGLQGGASGWFRSMAIPRRDGSQGGTADRELPSLSCSALQALEGEAQDGNRRAGKILSAKKQGAGAGSLLFSLKGL